MITVVMTAKLFNKRIQVASRQAANDAEAKLASDQLRQLAKLQGFHSPKIEALEPERN
ncbi:MAG: hypothetical protein ACR2M4_05635 [Actinomycetota bacterium]